MSPSISEENRAPLPSVLKAPSACDGSLMWKVKLVGADADFNTRSSTTACELTRYQRSVLEATALYLTDLELTDGCPIASCGAEIVTGPASSARLSRCD